MRIYKMTIQISLQRNNVRILGGDVTSGREKNLKIDFAHQSFCPISEATQLGRMWESWCVDHTPPCAWCRVSYLMNGTRATTRVASRLETFEDANQLHVENRERLCHYGRYVVPLLLFVVAECLLVM